MKIALTGDRPSGSLHLGHYIGSLKTRIELQKNHDMMIMIADLQAMTDYFNKPNIIQENVLNVVKDYISSGISPDISTIFLQSNVRSLSQITIYFMNLVSFARVRRNPTVKQELKSKDFKDNATCGFICYPISQAADILAFNSDVVPVGKDQLPMIEQANEIAETFNRIYKKEVLKKCLAKLSVFPKLMGIDGQNKASKSLNNAIFLSDSSEIVKQKVMNMYTDPNHIKITDPGNVQNNMVFHYLDAFYEDKNHLKELKKAYQKGGLGDVFLKNLLFDVLENLLNPIRQKRATINDNDATEILINGTKKAEKIANETLLRMEEAMSFKLSI